jgi:ribosomal protein S18 acetylase RimI-like enzyme
MPIEITAEPPDSLSDYATISIGFTVSSRLRIDGIESGLGGIRLMEEKVNPPYLKDYDSLGEGPLNWPKQWDLSNWAFFIARENGTPVGACAVAWRTPKLRALEESDDLAVLWDLRVNCERRRQGIARQLVDQAASWAKQRQCRMIKVETQNNNVAACRFYAACRFRVCGIQPGAYPEFPDEVMLLWSLDLRSQF